MPFYQFQCSNEKCICHEQPEEVLLTLQEYELQKNSMRCSICGSEAKRVFNGSNLIRFKSGGFYSTDYRGKSQV